MDNIQAYIYTILGKHQRFLNVRCLMYAQVEVQMLDQSVALLNFVESSQVVLSDTDFY